MGSLGGAMAVPCGRYTSEPPPVLTATTREQQVVEERCLKLFLAHLDADGASVCRSAVPFDREKHIAYLLKGLEQLPSGFQALDASRPWLCYWIVHALDLLGHKLPEELASRTVAFLKRCQDPSGGYCGGPHPGQIPHLAPTYAAVNALVIIGTDEAYASIDRQRLYEFLRRRKDDVLGCFTMHEDGEVDVRGAYTAFAVASLTNVLTDELVSGTPEWIARCQTYEGGLGGEPGLEAHGGYAFCGAAALSITGHLGLLRLDALLRWLASCQKRLEGGFHGRTNKLVDGCYSFWQGATFAVVAPALNARTLSSAAPAAGSDPTGAELLASLAEADGSWLFDQGALQDYLMVCGQLSKGGLRDKPGKDPDYYHTCYCLSGLSVAQHSHLTSVSGAAERTTHCPYGDATMLARTDPRYNISELKVARAFSHFAQLPRPTEPS
mmetsp:Transcript_2720/g.7117  ORF Transcript_2720/g.7117 Transcript_2720/m.7117 type:complete len:439 (-) Transcript_2720:283-1599(-)